MTSKNISLQLGNHKKLAPQRVNGRTRNALLKYLDDYGKYDHPITGIDAEWNSGQQ